jgi:CelD/BcsL family acetyltransferase involved in cellulose biosynthesis
MTALDVQVLDEAAAGTIQGEWAALSLRSTVYSSTSGYDYIATGWATREAHLGDRMAIVTVRRAGALVGLWPLFVRQERRKSVAKQIGNGSDEEYGDPLIEATADEGVIAGRLLTEARRLADLLIVRNLWADGPMARTVAAARGAAFRWPEASSVAGLVGAPSFDAWFAGKSRRFRHTLRNERRRLVAKGTLESRIMVGPEDGRRLAEWLIPAKRAWLKERGITESWLYSDQALDCCRALLSRPNQDEAFGVAILLDEQIVAGGWVQVSRGALEYYVTAFDQAYNRERPGNLLAEDLVRMAISRDMDLDFRMTRAAYKDRWADRLVNVSNAWLANSPKGVISVLAQHLRTKLRRKNRKRCRRSFRRG